MRAGLVATRDAELATDFLDARGDRPWRHIALEAKTVVVDADAHLRERCTDLNLGGLGGRMTPDVGDAFADDLQDMVHEIDGSRQLSADPQLSVVRLLAC